MRDILQDIVNHTNKLGFLNIVKVTGDDQKTQVDSMADDRSVIMYAETKDPQPSMKGVFGMPQLEKLRYLVEGKEYQVFIFGDQSSHGGEFVFATGVTGKLNKAWTWPVNAVLSILKIADGNNTKMSFSNDGAMQIELDSGIATYKYIIPAQA